VIYYFHHYYWVASTTQAESPNGPFDCYVIDQTHPVICVGGHASADPPVGSSGSGEGSHGSYPIYGTWQAISPSGYLGFVPQIDETVDGSGLFISYTDIVDQDRADNDGVVIIKEPSSYDFSVDSEMSWLDADILWGYPWVVSMGSDVPGMSTGVGNQAASGPAFNDGWDVVDWDIAPADGIGGYDSYPRNPGGHAHVSDMPLKSSVWVSPTFSSSDPLFNILYFHDITSAIAAVNQQGIVYVKQGTYPGFTVTKPVRIIGCETRDRTSITSDIAISADDVTIQGLTIINGGITISMYTRDTYILDNTIINGDPAIYISLNANNNTIENNIISNAAYTGIYISGDEDPARSSDNTITENDISYCPHYGIHIDGSNTNTITQNYLHQNNLAGIHLSCYWHTGRPWHYHVSSYNTITHNIVSDNGCGIDCSISSYAGNQYNEVHWNDFFSNTQQAYDGNTNNNWNKNYWSDYSSTGSYSIPGSQASDTMPYVSPVNLVCGDADGSGSISITDAVFLIAYIFGGGSTPTPICRGDCNGDESIDISDACYLISYIFSGGPAPQCP
jgi:parallel beta-helix repeat protein